MRKKNLIRPIRSFLISFPHILRWVQADRANVMVLFFTIVSFDWNYLISGEGLYRRNWELHFCSNRPCYVMLYILQHNAK